ncbi:MAG: hypothetical protein KY462_05635 [Actinobacteria bacterium]|nr:hypothetical protein [Actinomycetota bacterium]
MKTTTGVSDRVSEFVADVAHHFDDLPPAERADLLDDLQQHLLELAAEDEASLERELVDPAAYAAEVRHSAGLPEPAIAKRRRMRRLAGWVTVRIERLRDQPVVREVVEFLPQLRPAWWALRGWAVVAGVSLIIGGGPWWRQVPFPGRGPLGLIAAAAAIVTSVKVGRDERDHRRPWRALDLGAAVVVVLITVEAMSGVTGAADVHVPQETLQPPVLRHPDGEPITNLYLFDADGQPLEDVHVYDGRGRPIEIGDLNEAGFANIDTVYPRDPFGNPIANRYPLTQYLVHVDESGTTVRTKRPVPDVDPSGRRPNDEEVPAGEADSTSQPEQPTDDSDATRPTEEPADRTAAPPHAATAWPDE